MTKWLVATGFILVVGALVAFSIAQPKDVQIIEPLYPEPTGYVVDSAKVLKLETTATLEAKLKAFDSTAQIAVVTVETIQPLTVEEYGIKLAEKWKVGHKEYDNGVILIVVTKDRKVRIEVGKGLEGQINDSKAGRILDVAIVPYLKNNDWDGGVSSGVEAIINAVK